jgi:hypothetical protein
LSRIFHAMDESELRDLGNRVGKAINGALPKGGHFVCLFFDDDQIGQYVCDCERASMITILLETADRLLSDEDVCR